MGHKGCFLNVYVAATRSVTCSLVLVASVGFDMV